MGVKILKINIITHSTQRNNFTNLEGDFSSPNMVTSFDTVEYSTKF